MICRFRLIFSFLLACVLGAHAEQHRATHLGNPATRFAPPLHSPEEMRSRFRDPQLRPDFESVLQQWGWTGKVQDLFTASQTAPVSDILISPGTMLPFMSSREKGRPICLRNVLWAGKEPAPAYAFDFDSNARRYRCIVPKACSNFLVEDHGPVPAAELAMECHAPAEVPVGRPLKVCLRLRNSGNASASKATVHLAIPGGAVLQEATAGGRQAGSEVLWDLGDLGASNEREVCAQFVSDAPIDLSFSAFAGGADGRLVPANCATHVFGVSAILIDAVDLQDPVQVGSEVTYEIKVTNQGSSPGTNVRLACQIPASEQFVSGGGATPVREEGGAAVTEPLPSLAPKEAAVWRVVVKALQAGDARFKIQLTSDQFQQPINEEESTQLY